MNCTPSLAIENKSAYECLYASPRCYDLHWVFGCACFVCSLMSVLSWSLELSYVVFLGIVLNTKDIDVSTQYLRGFESLVMLSSGSIRCIPDCLASSFQGPNPLISQTLLSIFLQLIVSNLKTCHLMPYKRILHPLRPFSQTFTLILWVHLQSW